MEEKQVEIKQEPMPAQEPKRPRLLSFILILTVIVFCLAVYTFIIGQYSYKIYSIALALFMIYACIAFWKGYKWARVAYLVLGIIYINNAIIFTLMAKSHVELSIEILYILMVTLYLLMLLYVFLDKNIKAYCNN